MSLNPTVTEVERLFYCGDVVAIGGFRCPSDHPLFADSGPTSGYLMVFPRTSTVVIQERGSTVTAAPPSTVFYNCGQAYRREAIDAADSSDWYMIAPDIVREIVAQHDAGAADRENWIFSFFNGPASASTYLMQRALFTELSDGEAVDDLYVEEMALAIFESAVAEAAAVHPRKVSRRRARIDAAIEAGKALIAANLTETISLRRLAAAVECSPYQFCRAFQKTTGYKITEYRHALRLRRALDLLRDTRSDLTDIALDLGYSSHSHFTMVFRKHFGMTPSEFRCGRRLDDFGFPQKFSLMAAPLSTA